jgi:3-hydroxyisobutyrate dehydrogenase-like beta-hydroxyacid dehydrogenase
MKKIGFIGLGKMGLPMAMNLCKAGFEVTVCSSKPESSATVVELGGKTAASYVELARGSEIVITIVPADKEIKELYLGENGLLANVPDGGICIDMTSGTGDTMLLLRDSAKAMGRDVSVVDAPVSGGVAGAQNGKLTIVVGCDDKALFEKCMPVFQAMGEKIYYTGALGSGSNIKMINQMLNAANTAIAAEAICMAKKLGVDLNTLVEIVNKSSGQSFIFEKNVPKFMLTGDHTPGFRLDLMKKDVSLFVEAAKNSQAFTPLSEMVYQIYKATSNQGGGDKNYTYIIDWFEKNQ